MPVRKNIRLPEVFRSASVKENIVQAVPFWIASVITGLVSVAYTKLFGLSEQLLSHCLQWQRSIIFLIAPISFVIAGYLVMNFAPGARGSGIPQVMATIDSQASTNDKNIGKLLGLRIIVVKICSSILMVFGGGAIGREGPTIQISTTVFHLVYKWIPSGWSRLSRKSYYITGAAAGLAAAFNTPLGGVVFAMEELARIHVSFFRTALFSAVIIAGLTAQGFLGPYLYLGYPDVHNLSHFVFLSILLAAGISGVMGALMSKALLMLIRWKSSFSKTENVIAVIIIGLIIASIAYFVNPEILGSGKDTMNKVLFTGDKHMSFSTVLARFTGPVLSFNTGAAGGVFAPSLAAGASIGAWIADIFRLSSTDCNILVLSGMVGFLTGVTRTPFTSAILVLEMTDRHSVVFYLMLAALVSGVTAMLIDKHSLYEQLKNNYMEELNGTPPINALSPK